MGMLCRHQQCKSSQLFGEIQKHWHVPNAVGRISVLRRNARPFKQKTGIYKAGCTRASSTQHVLPQIACLGPTSRCHPVELTLLTSNV